MPIVNVNRNEYHELAKGRDGVLCGVNGRFNDVYVNAGNFIKKQVFVTEWRKYSEEKNCKIRAEIRFDDECGNKHESFAITGEVREGYQEYKCGCIHDDIEKYFPELKHLIKWHLMNIDAPMHYVADALYHATNRDGGKLAGEPNRWENKFYFDGFPISQKMCGKFIVWLNESTITPINPDNDLFIIVPVPYKKDGGYEYADKYTFVGYECEWYKAPFDSIREAEEFKAALSKFTWRVNKVVTGYSKGKERNLNAARSCAIWPEATDEQLCSDNLEQILIERLPGLVEAFKNDVLACGLIYPVRQ